MSLVCLACSESTCVIVLCEIGSCGSRAYVPYRGCELEPRMIKPMFDVGQVGFLVFFSLLRFIIYPIVGFDAFSSQRQRLDHPGYQ